MHMYLSYLEYFGINYIQNVSISTEFCSLLCSDQEFIFCAFVPLHHDSIHLTVLMFIANDCISWLGGSPSWYIFVNRHEIYYGTCVM